MLALPVNCPTFLKHQARIRLERTLDAALRSRDGLAVQRWWPRAAQCTRSTRRSASRRALLQRCGGRGGA